MPFAEDQDMIQAVASERGLDGCLLHQQSHVSFRRVRTRSESAIPLKLARVA